MTKIILMLFLLQAFLIYNADCQDENHYKNQDFTPIYYPQPTPSENDFYYYPNFDEYVEKTRGKYPKFSRIPITHFSCRDFPFPGYFADVVTGCQVFHMCAEDGRRSSFLCPNQTIYNQQTLVCDWWHNVDCQMSSQYYHMNDFKFSAKYNQGKPNHVNDRHFQNDYGSRINKDNSEYQVFNNDGRNAPALAQHPQQFEYNNNSPPMHSAEGGHNNNNNINNNNYEHQNQFGHERPHFENVNQQPNQQEGVYTRDFQQGMDGNNNNNNFHNANGREYLHYAASNQTATIHNKLKNVSVNKLNFLLKNISNIIRQREKLKQS